MSKAFWDERYASRDFVYGTAPNAFLATQLRALPAGKILLPAEGEGRNAVFCATQGWEVTAFDQSESGRKKAMQLATTQNVQFDYRISSIEDFTPPATFDVIALVYAHFPPAVREHFHRRLQSWLKPGGRVILEGFHKDQLRLSSGGPKSEAMLFSPDQLAKDFDQLTLLQNEVQRIELDEGEHHRGEAVVVRLVGVV